MICTVEFFFISEQTLYFTFWIQSNQSSVRPRSVHCPVMGTLLVLHRLRVYCILVAQFFLMNIENPKEQLLLQRDEIAQNIDADREREIVQALQRIDGADDFLIYGMCLDTRFVGAVRSSCMVPSVYGSDLQRTMRGYIARATFAVGETMSLGDAIAYFCRSSTDREKTLLFQLLRPLFIEYGERIGVSTCFPCMVESRFVPVSLYRPQFRALTLYPRRRGRTSQVCWQPFTVEWAASPGGAGMEYAVASGLSATV